MIGSFSFPMRAERSRNKERLEATLAGLCELDLLKQRQECLVLGALSLGDSLSLGKPSAGRPVGVDLRAAHSSKDEPHVGAQDEFALRRQTNKLLCTPWGLMASLEQQVGKLRMDMDNTSLEQPADLGDSNTSSGEGFVTKSDGPTEFGSSNLVPPFLLAPYGSLEGLAKGAVESEERATWSWSDKLEAEAQEDLGKKENGDSMEEDQQSQRLESYMFGLIQRRTQPSRFYKPRTSLAHESQSCPMAKQSGSHCKEDLHTHMQASPQGMSEFHSSPQSSEGSSPWGCCSLDQAISLREEPPSQYPRLPQSTQDKPGIYQRPRHPLVNASHLTSAEYPPYRAPLDPQQLPEHDSSQHTHSYPSPPPPLLPHSLHSADEQLVSAEYIPAQPCRSTARVSAHTHSNSLKCSGASKPSRAAYSPERCPRYQHQQSAPPQSQHSKFKGGPKKCRLNEDKGGGAPRKAGRKACRSQSENSLQRVPERKYNTVERDGGGSGSGGGGSRGGQPRGRKPQQGSGGYRRWRSTLELSQDEADQPPTQLSLQAAPAAVQREQGARRTRRSRPTPPLYAYPHSNHHHSHLHQHMEYQMERDRLPPCRPDDGYSHLGHGESESSLSEAESPDSISLSSDSDESGGLVWPQQLPPQLLPPSSSTTAGAPLQPKAFIKIKASHALKKKILRFRTGSLKVMTTV